MLHIIECLTNFGGTARKLLYLARHFPNNNHRLVFLTYQPSVIHDRFEKEGAKVINANTLSPWRICREIVRVAGDTEADVLCTHFTRPLVTGVIAGRWLGLPVIHNEHSPCDLRGRLGGLLARAVYPFVDAVICNSQYTADSVLRTYNISAAKLHVVHNPIEARRPIGDRQAVRAELGLSERDCLIGHTGGMTSWRDQQTLIRAFGEIYETNRRLRLLLIGDGPLRPALENLAADSGLADAVHFIGYSDRIGDYLSAMDIYVNPAVAEGFGIAVVEAMLAGLPVVLADAGAHPELVQRDVDGVLYAPRNSMDLGELLRGLIDDRQRRVSLGANAQTAARARFAPERYAAQYCRIVQDTLAARTCAYIKPEV
ncbi:glycosyltransferase family 4 protein [Methylocaldum sp. GT1BB]|jgi:glycosyltransferase involved in cell wall biosynthesis|uniref:glycosyltransferase family 4 protein n=1 Tax=Methylocaldum sp. GT1BB TaxID=3438963 RepID=UPI003DA02C3B